MPDAPDSAPEQDSAVAERQKTWDRQVTGALPALLRHLLDSPVYGHTRDRPLPPERPLAPNRKENCDDPEFMEEFRRQCGLIRDMGVHVVAIDDNKVAAVFEIYAATVLRLPQSFAVS